MNIQFRMKTLWLLPLWLVCPDLLPAQDASPLRSDLGQTFVPTDVDWNTPVYETSFDSQQVLEEWLLEGGKQAQIESGKLVLQSRAAPVASDLGRNPNHLVYWLKKEMPADFLLEFSLCPLDRAEGLNIVFFNTRGLAGQSIFDPTLEPRTGIFKQYHSGDLNCYHISYWAGERGTANIRKNRGFNLVASGNDLITTGPPGEFQTVRIYKRGRKIRLMVDDVVAAAFDDDGQTYGPVHTHSGWIGLRQMGHTLRCVYERLAVYPLVDDLQPGKSISVPLLGVLEQTFNNSSPLSNPYVDVVATASIVSPQGSVAEIPLFWDGADVWRFRFSPNAIGSWKWNVTSNAAGLDGKSGDFEVIASDNLGGVQPMKDYPYHFQNQSGRPFWFMGDTAWALFADDQAERLDWPNVKKYLDQRSAQRFNVVHAMLISEISSGNRQGSPFAELATEQINPNFWSEVDRRIRYANQQDITVGLVLAWSNKPHSLNSWASFPSRTAQLRYARYVAARYSAYNVFFILAGEWNYDVRQRAADATEEQVLQLYDAFAEAVSQSDPHQRMITLHPSTRPGTVHEFATKSWMSFGNYQQRYTDLHQSVLEVRDAHKPVVNAEYAYYLRDQSEKGLTDKHNSADVDMIRHATWDIAMAGGYFITGFGSTYAGGKRNPGPFRVDNPRNADWEQQVAYVQQLFTSLDWWQLEPRDDLIASLVDRGSDESRLGVTAPPTTTYWALANPGHQYVYYMRGSAEAYQLSLGERATADYQLTQFDPRNGTTTVLGNQRIEVDFPYTPPDAGDWILMLTKQDNRP